MTKNTAVKYLGTGQVVQPHLSIYSYTTIYTNCQVQPRGRQTSPSRLPGKSRMRNSRKKLCFPQNVFRPRLRYWWISRGVQVQLMAFPPLPPHLQGFKAVCFRKGAFLRDSTMGRVTWMWQRMSRTGHRVRFRLSRSPCSEHNTFHLPLFIFLLAGEISVSFPAGWKSK